MPHGRRIAELLLSIGAVELRLDPPFTWTSGIKSPIYCDNRMLYSHPEPRKIVIEALVSRVRALHIEPDVIAGTATAAIGWAALVADRLGLPFVYVRSQAKGHGQGKLIEGDLPVGKDVVLIEDLLSTGGSAMRSVDALKEEGQCQVHDVLAIFSYEFPSAMDGAQARGLQLHPLSDFTTLLSVAKDQGRLEPEQIKIVAQFARDPEAWRP